MAGSVLETLYTLFQPGTGEAKDYAEEAENAMSELEAKIGEINEAIQQTVDLPGDSLRRALLMLLSSAGSSALSFAGDAMAAEEARGSGGSMRPDSMRPLPEAFARAGGDAPAMALSTDTQTTEFLESWRNSGNGDFGGLARSGLSFREMEEVLRGTETVHRGEGAGTDREAAALPEQGGAYENLLMRQAALGPYGNGGTENAMNAAELFRRTEEFVKTAESLGRAEIFSQEQEAGPDSGRAATAHPEGTLAALQAQLRDIGPYVAGGAGNILETAQALGLVEGGGADGGGGSLASHSSIQEIGTLETFLARQRELARHRTGGAGKSGLLLKLLSGLAGAFAPVPDEEGREPQPDALDPETSGRDLPGRATGTVAGQMFELARQWLLGPDGNGGRAGTIPGLEAVTGRTLEQIREASKENPAAAILGTLLGHAVGQAVGGPREPERPEGLEEVWKGVRGAGLPGDGAGIMLLSGQLPPDMAATLATAKEALTLTSMPMPFLSGGRTAAGSGSVNQNANLNVAGFTVNTQGAEAGYEAGYRAARKLLNDEIEAAIDHFDNGLIA